MRALRAILGAAFCIVLAFGPVACHEDGSSNDDSNTRPAANAGSNQNVLTGVLVTLDGSDSFDVDGDPLTYWWMFTSVPSGSGVSLSDPTAVYPTFTPDVEGDYVVLLEVSDGTEQDTSAVKITAADYLTPAADAGPDLNVITGSLVALDAGGSSGDSLTYTWTLTSVPFGSGAFLSDPSAVDPTFTADMDGDYVVNLTVDDVTANSASDTVTITAFTKFSSFPDTGQTTCYDVSGTIIDCVGTGQDAEYSINPLSYTDNGNGTITDNITDLMWQQEDDGQVYNWYEASGTFDATYNPDTTDVCGSLTLGGHSDWRLPSVMELTGIIDYGTSQPLINTAYFPNIAASPFWSSTTAHVAPGRAWYVSFGSLFLDTFAGSSDNFVLCVRGTATPAQSFTDNGLGTVTDNNTGLMWQKCTALSMSYASCSEGQNVPVNWQQALDYCNALDLDGYTDWRLPNVKELLSIVDYGSPSPMINTSYFPNTPQESYWSSTSTFDIPSYAQIVSFSSGRGMKNIKTDSWYVRCVR